MISWSIFRTKRVKLGLMSCPDDLYNDISLNSVLLTFEDDYIYIYMYIYTLYKLL